MPKKQKERLKLMHGSLMYRDNRLSGYDAATVVDGAVNGDVFRAYVEQVLVPLASNSCWARPSGLRVSSTAVASA